MTDQEQKLREAVYFYKEMVESFSCELLEQFNYNLSSFLTASRVYCSTLIKSLKVTDKKDKIYGASHSRNSIKMSSLAEKRFGILSTFRVKPVFIEHMTTSAN